jgi:NADH dehydrogenase
MKVLVAGATGMLGSEICRRALAYGHDVIGLVRADSDPASVARLRALGVEVREAELTEPASLPAAVAGATAVISGVTAVHQRVAGQALDDVDRIGQGHLIAAASAAGVSRFIYVSVTGRLDRDDPLTTAKRASEEALRASGMSFTILRPTYFMEIWLSPRLGFDYPNARATIYGDGERPISWVSFTDVAELAVRSLDHPAAPGAVLEVGGPEALSPLEVVRTFEEAGGREFTVEHVPEAALEQQYREAAGPMPRTFASLMLGYAAGDEIAMAATAAGFGIRLCSVQDYARAVLGASASPPNAS